MTPQQTSDLVALLQQGGLILEREVERYPARLPNLAAEVQGLVEIVAAVGWRLPTNGRQLQPRHTGAAAPKVRAMK